MIVLATVGARRRRRFERSRPREAESQPDPEPVAVSRATVVYVGEPFEDPSAARRWLHRARPDLRSDLEHALGVLNRVVHAHRVAAADPYARDVAGDQALAARIGYGEGDHLAEGRWSRAIELGVRPRRLRRVAALRPQERLAALLGGRDRALVCEELVLRARLDLDEGRPRQSALQLRVALEAALAELEAEAELAGTSSDHLDDLRRHRSAVGAAANLALGAELDPATLRAVQETIERLEAALRARSART